MLFQITSTEDEDLPFATIGYGGFRSDIVLGWQGFSSRGARCVLLRENLQGVQTTTGRMTVGLDDAMTNLQQQSTSQSISSHVRPSLVAADLDCDQPVNVGDSITLQIRFFIRRGFGWTAVDYTFNNFTVGR
jgi:hypothetical protein